MPATPWQEATRAELYVRSDLPTPSTKCQRTTVERLEAVAASGALDEHRVTSWAKRVPADGDHPTGEFERERYAAFAAWAERAGVRLAPFFDTRECYSSVTGERRTELVLPAACLALYDGEDDLVAVVPHADDEGTVTVRECLSELAEGGDADPARPATTAD